MPNLGLPLWAQAKRVSSHLGSCFLQQPLKCMLSGSSNPVPLKSRYLILEYTAAIFGNHDNSRPSFVMTRLSSYVSPQPRALCHNMMAVLFGSIVPASYLSEVPGDNAFLSATSRSRTTIVCNHNTSTAPYDHRGQSIPRELSLLSGVLCFMVMHKPIF